LTSFDKYTKDGYDEKNRILKQQRQEHHSQGKSISTIDYFAKYG
jgi:hypothetical protein